MDESAVEPDFARGIALQRESCFPEFAALKRSIGIPDDILARMPGKRLEIFDAIACRGIFRPGSLRAIHTDMGHPHRWAHRRFTTVSLQEIIGIPHRGVRFAAFIIHARRDRKFPAY